MVGFPPPGTPSPAALPAGLGRAVAPRTPGCGPSPRALGLGSVSATLQSLSEWAPVLGSRPRKGEGGTARRTSPRLPDRTALGIGPAARRSGDSAPCKGIAAGQGGRQAGRAGAVVRAPDDGDPCGVGGPQGGAATEGKQMNLRHRLCLRSSASDALLWLGARWDGTASQPCSHPPPGKRRHSPGLP